MLPGECSKHWISWNLRNIHNQPTNFVSRRHSKQPNWRKIQTTQARRQLWWSRKTWKYWRTCEPILKTWRVECLLFFWIKKKRIWKVLLYQLVNTTSWIIGNLILEQFPRELLIARWVLKHTDPSLHLKKKCLVIVEIVYCSDPQIKHKIKINAPSLSTFNNQGIKSFLFSLELCSRLQFSPLPRTQATLGYNWNRNSVTYISYMRYEDSGLWHLATIVNITIADSFKSLKQLFEGCEHRCWFLWL